MAVTLSPRIGLVRWSSDLDQWSREQIDGNMGSLDDLAVVSSQGTNATRPVAGVERRLYLASDTSRAYLDDGDEWHELAFLGTENAWTARQTFPGGIAYTPSGGIAATTVHGAIAELDTEKLAVTHTSASGAHAATNITVTPSGGIAATTVQSALVELDTEKAPVAHSHNATQVPLVTPINISGIPLLENVEDAVAALWFAKQATIETQGTYNMTGSADRTLGAYASDPESAPYTTTGASADIASKDDLNALREAYENLRVYVEDLGGVLVGVVDDLKTVGVLG